MMILMNAVDEAEDSLAAAKVSWSLAHSDWDQVVRYTAAT